MTALDTGICAPESAATLLRQQRQLLAGNRDVQMFPVGTDELALPEGIARHENERGVFHFRRARISPAVIETLSNLGRENEFLNLGPYSKSDIAQRAMAGEKVTCVAEYGRDGTELRCAAASDGTLARQVAYFQQTREPDGVVVVGKYPTRVLSRERDA